MTNKINYTTRITQEEKKKIKLYAIEHDMKDNEVISKALVLLFQQ